MAKTFTEMMAELAENVKVTAKGKEKKNFSRASFDDLFTAFLNENDYETEVVTLKGGELDRKTIKPVAEFRKVFYNTLLDFGVDKQEAQKILDGSYQFSKTPGAYEFTSEIMENYLKHKKFNFLSKEDLNASISLETVDEGVKESRIPNSDEKVKHNIKKHRKIKASSKAPKWAKIKID